MSKGFGIVNIEAQACGLRCVVSDQVPRSVDVTGHVCFVSLSMSADEWADIILENRIYCREDCRRYITASGFDMTAEALKMQEYYLQSVRK